MATPTTNPESVVLDDGKALEIKVGSVISGLYRRGTWRNSQDVEVNRFLVLGIYRTDRGQAVMFGTLDHTDVSDAALRQYYIDGFLADGELFELDSADVPAEWNTDGLHLVFGSTRYGTIARFEDDSRELAVTKRQAGDVRAYDDVSLSTAVFVVYS